MERHDAGHRPCDDAHTLGGMPVEVQHFRSCGLGVQVCQPGNHRVADCTG